MVASDRELQAEREATDWFGRLQSRSVSTQELTDFARWRRDPMNARAYERAESLWNASRQLKDDPDVEDALRGALGRRRIRRWLTHMATDRIALTVGASFAALAAVILLLPLSSMPWSTPAYQTGVGERSVVQLDDGSRVQLDTNSQMKTHLTNAERRVDLVSGRAFFDVHHDPAHPFVVEAGDRTTVTALGTRFDVRRDGSSILVSLFEGSVAVADTISGSSVRLAPGQSVRVTDGVFGAIAAPSTAGQPGWRDGRLSFRETPLSTALTEINRYTSRPLRIARPGIADQPVSGDFSTTDIDGFAAATNTIFGTGAVIRDATTG